MYEAEAFGDASDVGSRGLGGSGCNGNGRGAEDVEELVGGDPPDPVALEKALKGPALDPPGLRGRRHLGPEVEDPGLDHAADRIEDLRIVAPQLLPHAVRQARAVPRELLVDPRPRPEFDDDRVDEVDPAEVVEIGPQRVGEDAGVEAVVLGAGGRVAWRKLRTARFEPSPPTTQTWCASDAQSTPANQASCLIMLPPV